jgi:hypothetical protein
MESLACRRLLASDCLFAGDLALTGPPDDRPSCARFSRVPEEAASEPNLLLPSTTSAEPVFFDFETCRDGGPRPSTDFGEAGHGVLHPATPEAIASGAEDGGEMGAYHHHRTSLARAAVLAKLGEFLPVGMEAALVPDPRLLAPLPELATE